MPDKVESQRNPRILGFRILFVFSICLNLVLVAWLLLPSNRYTAVINFRSQARSQISQNMQSSNSASGGSTDRTQSETNHAGAFKWKDVESSDYRVYMANLRAIGCPEQTVRDVVSADLLQLFSDRAKEIRKQPTKEYWQKFRQENPSPEQEKKLKLLSEEQKQISKSLFGATVRVQEMIDLLYVQIHAEDKELASLPKEKGDAARKVLDESGYFEEMEKLQEDHNPKKEQALLDKKMDLLKEVLSPDELKRLRIRLSREASSLRSQLKYFEATEEEFNALLEVRKKMSDDKNVPKDFYAEKEAENDAVRQVFGEERGKIYEQNSDLFYVWARQAAERYGLPEESAAQAFQIKQQFMAEANRLRRDETLSLDQRKTRLSELHKMSSFRLNGIFGTEALAYANRGDGWLKVMEQRLKP